MSKNRKIIKVKKEEQLKSKDKTENQNFFNLLTTNYLKLFKKYEYYAVNK
jgi:hypothetical protein